MNKDKNIELGKDELTGDEFISDHDYDGIKELNNPMPKWWLWMFYISIIFAAIYMIRYHVLNTAALQDEEYATEMAMATQKYKSTETALLDENNVSVLTDESNMQAGKIIFDKLCLVCHLSKGEGLVGPNLTDKYWIHGGSIGDIFRIIRVGNPSKGMISWKDQLSPKEMQQVSSYIYALEGTNPPNQKEAQGELFERNN